MIRVFYLQNNMLTWEKFPGEVTLDREKKYLWIDLLNAHPEARNKVEEFFDVKLQTYQEAIEIESSSRYHEDETVIKANSGFLSTETGSLLIDDQPELQQISFLLKDALLFTVRNVELNVFAETVRKLKITRRDQIRSGFNIWLILLETRIDADADYIESLTRITSTISSGIQKQTDFDGKMLRKIAELQENSILIRESIIDKQRLISALLRSSFIGQEDSERLRVIMKDVVSLLQHTQFSFERLEYLQDTMLGLVNIEQNKIIKIFTVVSVIFLPPTLIASVYGMNFRMMPELQWAWGYPVAILLMVASSVFTLLLFRKKRWI